MRKGVCMKKKLVVMAVLLSAICFTGFAQEAPNLEASQYIAKASEEKEYTFIVFGQVQIDGKWVDKREKFVFIAKSMKGAQTRAHNTFVEMYCGNGGVRNVKITCEAVKDNVCKL